MHHLHLPGLSNQTADWESRQQQNGNWMWSHFTVCGWASARQACSPPDRTTNWAGTSKGVSGHSSWCLSQLEGTLVFAKGQNTTKHDSAGGHGRTCNVVISDHGAPPTPATICPRGNLVWSNKLKLATWKIPRPHRGSFRSNLSLAGVPTLPTNLQWSGWCQESEIDPISLESNPSLILSHHEEWTWCGRCAFEFADLPKHHLSLNP